MTWRIALSECILTARRPSWIASSISARGIRAAEIGLLVRNARHNRAMPTAIRIFVIRSVAARCCQGTSRLRYTINSGAGKNVTDPTITDSWQTYEASQWDSLNFRHSALAPGQNNNPAHYVYPQRSKLGLQTGSPGRPSRVHSEPK